jgi:hypothetical protein
MSSLDPAVHNCLSRSIRSCWLKSVVDRYRTAWVLKNEDVSSLSPKREITK